MTENEAMKEVTSWTSILLGSSKCTEETACAQDMAIKALEEIQQYRAIGTAEEITRRLAELERWHTSEVNPDIKNVFANMSTQICHNCDHKDEYIVELEAEIEQYRAIGTVEECQEAVEKQKPKKPTEQYRLGTSGRGGKCPSCKHHLDRSVDAMYCVCGQRLDWSGEE